jgi:hypothetical protein
LKRSEEIRQVSSNHFSGEVVRREDNTTLLVEGWKNKWNVFALLTPKEAV